jgi:hypothetical protein
VRVERRVERFSGASNAIGKSELTDVAVNSTATGACSGRSKSVRSSLNHPIPAPGDLLSS